METEHPSIIPIEHTQLTSFLIWASSFRRPGRTLAFRASHLKAFRSSKWTSSNSTRDCYEKAHAASVDERAEGLIQKTRLPLSGSGKQSFIYVCIFTRRSFRSKVIVYKPAKVTTSNRTDQKRGTQKLDSNHQGGNTETVCSVPT